MCAPQNPNQTPHPRPCGSHTITLCLERHGFSRPSGVLSLDACDPAEPMAILPSDSFGVLLTLYALAGCALYLEVVRSFEGIERVANMRRWMAWLHPFAAPWRAWICLEAIGRSSFHARVTWRGRPDVDRS